MNNTTHTQGPWVAYQCLNGAISINVSPQFPIATVGGAGWHLGEKTAQANAQLITAAPELLAALVDIAAASAANCGDSLANAIQAAQTAINKAKGN